MIKEIKYNGFSATPSDYDCLDGDLACAMGVIPEDGALRPVPPPTTVLSLNSGEWVVKIHATPTFEHYLILDANNRLYWRTKEGSLKTEIADFVGREVMQVECIGNTVLVLCDDGIHYFLWKAYGQNYTHLGNKLPECSISFGLQGKGELSDSFSVSYSGQAEGHPTVVELTKADKVNVTEQVLSKVNAFIAEKATKTGCFMFPFFVRYAYRLYDGSLTHHSAPILMMPSTGAAPFVVAQGDIGQSETSFKVFGITAELDYQPVGDRSTFENIELWTDIIKSIDIFISAPIYTFDQSGEVEKIVNVGQNADMGYFYGQYTFKNGGYTEYVIGSVSNYYVGEHYGAATSYVELPVKSKDDIASDISNCAQFYHLASIEVVDLNNARNKVEIPKGHLESLASREVMTDDYQSHDTLRPKTMFVYNNRINIANVERELFKGYDTASMVSYINGGVKGNANIYTHLNTQDGNFVVGNESSILLEMNPRVFPYLYYPDTCATKMWVQALGLASTDGEPYMEAVLTPHSFLNGSFYFNGFSTNEHWLPDLPSYVLKIPIVSTPNKIYTSEVNNPFHFPLSGINTIGTGEIIGMSTAAKALSEGQFGQFPLYAFTSDGVWAMEVSNTGGFSARQPITRDVCLSKDSITPIDNAVLFLTDRGVMLMSGSNSSCISNILDSNEQFSMWQLPYGEQVMEKAGIPESAFEVLPFKEYIRNARMLYDYVNQRVILYNANRSYAYMYSLESKAWGMINANIASGVNSYPNALAMTTDAKLVDFSQENGTEGFKGLLVTRPLKLDAPTILKTVDAVIQRGVFKKGSVKSILYGSRDLCDWYLIASSKDHYLNGFFGTPYKYFRLALVCDLSDKESISGCSVEFTPKQTNNLR